jgi:hypothetical protein
MLQSRCPAARTIRQRHNLRGTVMNKALYLALAIIGTSTAAIAQQGTPPVDKSGQSFEQRKEQMLKRLDERMQAMQKSRDCLQQAKDENAARACRSERRQRGPGGPR